MKDEQILEWVRTGRQQKAFTKLYKHFTAIRKMIREKGGNKEDAEDIFQETLIIFSRKCEDPSFVLTASVSTYLYSVAKFLWSDERKRRARVGGLSETGPDIRQGDEWEHGTELRDVIEQEQKFKKAETVLSKIGEKCLQLLKLFYLENRSMKEIASKMEMNSEKIAKNQKYKCLERAKETYRQSLVLTDPDIRQDDNTQRYEK